MRFKDEVQTKADFASNKLLLLTLPKYNECSGKDDYETQEFKTKAENISKDIHDITQNARIGKQERKKARTNEKMDDL